MRARFSSILVLGLALALAGTADSGAIPAHGRIAEGAPLVPKDYFQTHVSFSIYGDAHPHLKRFEKVLSDIDDAGFHEIRVVFAWAELEPVPLAAGIHSYKWDKFDRYVEMAARHSLRVQPVLGYPPRWASADRNCVDGDFTDAAEPKELSAWRDSVDAFVGRYGRGGSFWERNPGLRYLPMTSYELFNEPNLDQFWCPRPNPERYADYLSSGADAVHGRDPMAKAIFGGVISGENISKGDPSMTSKMFLERTFAARPTLKRQVDAVGIHLYEFKSREAFFGQIRQFRQELRMAGVPDRMPLEITETGWLHRPGIGYTEERRASYYRVAIRGVPRSNCNVSGMTAFAWLTEEEPGRLFTFLGLANLRTREPYAVVGTINHQLRVMRGVSPAKPPTMARLDCRDMPKPDRDGDGIPDESDPKPLED